MYIIIIQINITYILIAYLNIMCYYLKIQSWYYPQDDRNVHQLCFNAGNTISDQGQKINKTGQRLVFPYCNQNVYFPLMWWDVVTVSDIAEQGLDNPDSRSGHLSVVTKSLELWNGIFHIRTSFHTVEHNTNTNILVNTSCELEHFVFEMYCLKPF